MAIRSKAGMFLAVGAPALGLSCALAPQARANGRMASANELVVSPVDPTFLAVETTVGLFFSHDTGATLGWVCEASVGYGDGGNEDPTLAVTPTQVLAGLREGVSASKDQGCSWTLTSTDRIVDLVSRRDDPHVVLALASAFSGVGDAGTNLYLTRILQTQDDGNTWTQQGAPIDPTLVVETIDIAPSDPSRIYIGGAGWRPADGGVERVGVVLASTNGGTSFTRTDIPFADPTQQKYALAYVSAVDPNNPDRLYVRIDDKLVDQLLVSDDGAKTFTMAYQATGPLLGFALSADGTKVFTGGPFDGVRFARTTADSGTSLSFSEQSTTAVSCLTSVGDTLYACIRVPGTTALQHVGVSTDDGVTFDTRSFFGCFGGPLACPGSTIAAQCNPNLSVVRGTIGQCPDAGVDAGPSSNGADAGSEDASVPADAGKAPSSPRGGCSCEAEQAASAMGGLSASVLFVAIALWRRRRPA